MEKTWACFKHNQFHFTPLDQFHSVYGLNTTRITKCGFILNFKTELARWPLWRRGCACYRDMSCHRRTVQDCTEVIAQNTCWMHLHLSYGSTTIIGRTLHLLKFL